MKKSVKGLLASTAGASLLLGGAGTLAFWSDSAVADGTPVNGGTLAIDTDAVNTGCAPWELDGDESAAGTYTAGDPLVPGDVLTRVCRYTVSAAGNRLRAQVGVSTPTLTGTDMGGMLDAAVTGLTVDGLAATALTEEDDGATLAVELTVTWDAADTLHQGAQAVLEDLTVSVTQVHS